jgi:hypothetical protein
MRPLALLLFLPLLTAQVAVAQWWGGADAGLGNWSLDNSDMNRGFEFNGAAGWESGPVLLEGNGMVAGDRHGASGHLAARMPFGSWTVTLDGRAAAQREGPGRQWGRLDGEMSLSYQHSQWGVWAGYRWSGGSHSVDIAVADPPDPIQGDTAGSKPTIEQSDPALPGLDATVTAGAWRQAGPVLLTLSLDD